MVLHGTSHDLKDANAMFQTWSYMGPLMISVPMPCPRHGLTGDLSSQCQRHVPDMVLHGTSHDLKDASAMSQTWSYMGPLMISRMPMPCPRHGLTWDLFTQMS
ncbi:hypothetical protein Gotur_004724 [Gossypium turneri]